MCEDLIKRLRAVVDGGREEKCDGCPYEEDYPCCVDCLDTLHKQAADAIEELEEKCQALAETLHAYEHPWIPVTEGLPKDFQKVLVFWREHSEPMIDTAFWQKDAKRFDGEHWVRMEDKVTHWMPLPQPPTECRQMVTDSNQLIGDSEQLDEPVRIAYKLEE